MSVPAGEAALLEHADGPSDPTPTTEQQIHGRSPTRIALDRLRHDKVAVVCFLGVMFFVLVAVFAPLICKAFGVELRAYPLLDAIDPITRYGRFGPPDHPFTWDAPLGVQPGTGNDLLAEWVYGCRTSLQVATIATVTTTVIGIVVGLIAGFAKGVLDTVLSFVIDVFLSFPYILGALTLAPIIVGRYAADEVALDRAQFFAIIFVLTFLGWMPLARLVRGEVLSLREREFVQAARVIGVPTRRILFKELLPNLTAPIIVSISLGLPAFVAAEAGFAYLGIGLTSRPSWGQTINRAASDYERYPLWLWPPVIGVMLLVLFLNLLGDAVRDAFDPKTRR